jgi:hypothetical protein
MNTTTLQKARIVRGVRYSLTCSGVKQYMMVCDATNEWQSSWQSTSSGVKQSTRGNVLL